MTQGSDSWQHLYALDNLRAAMMWLGIVLHVAVIHMAGPSLLPWRDNQTTPAADLLAAFIHAFRMPVFFILAGFFVALLIARHGPTATVKHRLRRLALPFAVFWPPLFLACSALALLFLHRMARGTWGLDLGLSPTEMIGSQGAPNTLHLWFLWLLLWLSLLTPLMQALMHRLVPGTGQTLGRWQLLWRPWGRNTAMVWCGPGTPFCRPGRSGHITALFYVFGLVLYAHRQVLLAHYMRRWSWYAGAGLILFLASGVVLEKVPAELRDAMPLGARLAFSWAYNACAWCWSFALIGVFRPIWAGQAAR